MEQQNSNSANTESSKSDGACSQSQQDLYHKETHCHSCGRFIGVYTRCPYCLALNQKRLSIRVFKVISVLLSTVGLVLLLFYAKSVKTPEIKIADIGPLSNFAHVRVVGTVKSAWGPKVTISQWGSLAFDLEQPGKDGIDKIRLTAYAKVAKEIEKQGLIPQPGDEISVEGQVRYQKQTASMLINAPEHIHFLQRKKSNYVPVSSPAEIKNAELKSITLSDAGSCVCTTGEVMGKKVFAGKGTNIALKDGSKTGFPVWVPVSSAKDCSKLSEGDVIKVSGRVKKYKNKPEIEVDKNSRFEVLSRASSVGGK